MLNAVYNVFIDELGLQRFYGKLFFFATWFSNRVLYIETRNSSGDEIANVNFLYDDIVHVLHNTIDSCINAATDRRGYVLERMCLPNSLK